MKKQRVIKFFVELSSQLLSSVLFLFLSFIPLMYMFLQLQKADNIYASALATILVNMVGNDLAHAPSTAMEFKGAVIGLAIGMAVLVIIWRLMVLVIQWEPDCPNEDQLFEIIHRVRRKNGQREGYCSWLLHVIDESEREGASHTSTQAH